MFKKIAVIAPVLALLALGACSPAEIKAGATIAVAAAGNAAAPACAAIAKGEAAPTTLCANAAGSLISILDYAARNGIKAHFVDRHHIHIDRLPDGRRDGTIR